MIVHFDSPITRTLNDGIPIIFGWVRSGVTPTVTVAFDNSTFVAVTGTVEEIGPSRYKLAYNSADRPTTTGLITYKISEGGDEGVFDVIISKPLQAVPTPVPSEFSAFGPKRVKTKEMEIEQFDPTVLDRMNRRNSNPHPSFCCIPVCIAVPAEEVRYCR